MKDLFDKAEWMLGGTVDDGETGDLVLPVPLHLGEEALKAGPPDVLPLIELRNNVFFPQTLTPISVGRRHTRQLVKELPPDDAYVAIVAQKDPSEDTPRRDGLYRVGTLAIVHKVMEFDEDKITLVMQGLGRLRVDSFVSERPYFRVRYSLYPEDQDAPNEVKMRAMGKVLRRHAELYMKMASSSDSKPIPPIPRSADINEYIGYIAMQMSIPSSEKQEILEMNSQLERVERLIDLLAREIEVLRLGEEIQHRTRQNLEKQQRDFILQQQIRTIQSELGENPDDNDVEKFAELGAKLHCSNEVREAYNREVSRLARMNPMSPDYSTQVAYLQLFAELPWEQYSKDNYDLARAQRILDRDHYGLEQVKDRILEYLAVLKLKNDLKSPILCLYGPPGVGKTSLGKSVARALGRKCARISLGGLHDESEIRGHRRTYVGAMPGRILQNLRKAKTSNPVFILDEVDKITSNMMGDPASALLEVLDPEQNSSFYDNYLEVEYDLSHVLFITTANDISAIPPALRDRMEMIEITGYLMEEKVAIATRHLIPDLLKQHGVKKSEFQLPPKLIASIITNYTRESGVRKLNQTLARLVRQQAKRIALGEECNKRLTDADVRERLGIALYDNEKVESAKQIGVAVGMAWTQVGGEILYVETSISDGKGTLAVTGNIGDVMRESATIALQYVRAQARALGIDPARFDSSHVHIHVPEGAIPKDGPSAGVTMVSSLVSAFKSEAPNTGIAMTGEITLRGRVLPVGGIKEKILAAKRANIHKIILPSENKKDLEDIKPEYLAGLEFVHVQTIDQMLGQIFAPRG